MTDVTAFVIRLGNPYADFDPGSDYGRNVWDLQSYGGKLYIGGGNASNISPDTTGPVPIMVYDPGTDQFTEQGVGGATISSDQVDIFRVIDFGGSEGEQLVIPSHDPSSGNTLAFFALKSGTWRAHVGNGIGLLPGLITGATHTYDVIIAGSVLIASLGNGAAVAAVSEVNNSGGEDWEGATPYGGGRFYSSFVLGGVAYVVGFARMDTEAMTVRSYDGSGVAFTDLGLTFSDVFTSETDPSEVVSTSSAEQAVIRRLTNFGSSLVYVGASIVNDHQGTPFGLYRVDEVSSSGGLDDTTFERLTLPNSAVPYDFLVDGATLYALGAHVSGANTVVGVYSTTDLSSWTEVFTFIPADVGGVDTSDHTFARSFEKLDDIWYFGLGSHTGTQPDNVGDILAYDASPPVSSGGLITQGF